LAPLEEQILKAVSVRGVVIRNAEEYGRGPVQAIETWTRLASRVKHGTYIQPGTNCWSFVHYDDLADLYYRALVATGPEKVFHGASETVSMRDLAGAIHRGFGFRGEPSGISLEEASRLTPGAHGLTGNVAISGDLARRALGWQPVHGILKQVEAQAAREAEWRRAT
jgi:nucleoside-diphosphate-sugar epimerase